MAGPRLALVLLLAGATAAADETSAESAAREHSAIGTGLYHAGRYEEALSPAIAAGIGDTFGGIAAGDIDGDSRADVLVSAQTTYYLLFDDGKGGLMPPLPANQAPATVDTLVRDFTGDQKNDAVLLTGQGAQLLLRVNQLGTLKPAIASPAGDYGPMAAGDFNGDGRLDIAIADRSANRVEIFLNSGQY
jgi:hypothetical protein